MPAPLLAIDARAWQPLSVTAQMTPPHFSIITVCFYAKPQLRSTVASFRVQVQDGGAKNYSVDAAGTDGPSDWAASRPKCLPQGARGGAWVMKKRFDWLGKSLKLYLF